MFLSNALCSSCWFHGVKVRELDSKTGQMWGLEICGDGASVLVSEIVNMYLDALRYADTK